MAATQAPAPRNPGHPPVLYAGGRYLAMDTLGVGAFGSVELVQDTRTKKLLAMKRCAMGVRTAAQGAGGNQGLHEHPRSVGAHAHTWMSMSTLPAAHSLKRRNMNKYLEAELVNHSLLRHPHIVQFRCARHTKPR